jgi:hypothetical protein
MVTHAKRDPKKSEKDDMYIEMSDIRMPLRGMENIYQPNPLKDKLNGSAMHMMSKQESSR